MYMSKESVKRTNISMKPEIDALLRSLSKKTGLKMATVIEKGILMFEKYTKTHERSQRKNVVQIDPVTHIPIKIWDSMIDAALHFGGKNQNTISRACWTQLNRPSPYRAFGYLWNYKSE